MQGSVSPQLANVLDCDMMRQWRRISPSIGQEGEIARPPQRADHREATAQGIDVSCRTDLDTHGLRGWPKHTQRTVWILRERCLVANVFMLQRGKGANKVDKNDAGQGGCKTTARSLWLVRGQGRFRDGFPREAVDESSIAGKRWYAREGLKTTRRKGNLKRIERTRGCKDVLVNGRKGCFRLGKFGSHVSTTALVRLLRFARSSLVVVRFEGWLRDERVYSGM